MKQSIKKEKQVPKHWN